MDGLCGRLAQKKEHHPNGWCSFLVTQRGFEPRTRRRKRHAHSRGGNVSPALRTAATAGHDSGPGFSYIESYAKNRHANACRFSGDPAGIRTPDPLLKRQLLCRLSYRVIADGRAPLRNGAGPALLAGTAGLEPANEGVKVPCLTTWLRP